eukprot:scaffold7211_cov247-Ochromonas_danica.AAC.12
MHLLAKSTEVWIAVTGNASYQVSNRGNVRRTQSQKLIKPFHRDDGHVVVKLDQRELVHRLVCRAFWPNKHNYKLINHIDGNKNNNAVTNLEWVSEESMIQANRYIISFMESSVVITVIMAL